MSSTSKIILDTCIISYLMKNHSLAKSYAPFIQGHALAISFITVGELYYGAEKNKWGEKRKSELERILKNFIVIPYGYETARCYGRIVADRDSKGKPIGHNDAWIAACAVHHSVSLVTHNAKDFVEITGLDVITECRTV